MSAVSKIFMLLCTITLIYGQSPGTRTRGKMKDSNTATKDKDTEDTLNKIDYGPMINKIQDQLSKLNLGALEQYNTDMSEAKKELNKISKRLEQFENTQKGLKEYQTIFDQTNDAVNSLAARVEKVEVSTTAAQKSTSSKDEIDSRIAKLSSSMTKEINENKEKLKSFDKTEIEKLREDVTKLEEVFTISTKNYDNSFKEMKDRFKRIEKEMRTYNSNLQTVYDSTIGSVFDRLVKKTLDYLADFGEICVNIGGIVVDKIQSIDWKSYYDTITDPKQQQLFKEWVLGVVNYVKFWWMTGIQPAIIKQATELYLGVQTGTKDAIKFVHTHVLYLELTTQAQPYLDMANVPQEFTGYIVDGFLVLFVISSLFTLSFVSSMMCDCCCPIREPTEGQGIEVMEMPKQTTKGGKKGKGKRRK